MRLKSIELSGFKSFAKKTPLEFASAITAVVGPNGSGKSNIAESFRFVLGEQSMKSMRGRKGEDLIWNGSASSPRAGRAGVKLVFDNSDRMLNLDFDEVSIERVVHRDGVNDYMLNGSLVRLRDVAELLASANIGSSGHHIISQGEADRILSASSKERREMIEDALGLTAYLYKREEAERKLEKTAENMREVSALRRELAPHLKFLSTQVKKIEESEVLREQLKETYLEYLHREYVYLQVTSATLTEELLGPTEERASLDV
ncbi:MAG: AAA family ATPase, partial [Patescibacteria group bacterium]|nr:AAA family ATPase [Patescibacteria group bacterium]